MSDKPEPLPLRKWLVFLGRLIFVFVISSIPMLSESQRAAVTRALHDPLAVLAGRSPGARGDGPLLQTKSAQRQLPAGSNLLSANNVIPPAMLVPPRNNVLAEGAIPYALPRGGGSVSGLSPTSQAGSATGSGGSPGGGGSAGGGGGAVAASGGGGGGGPKGGSFTANPPEPDSERRTTNTTDIVPVNVVPEPASWAMLLTGFFLLGGLLRRYRSAHPTHRQPH
jgi:hypothetical protein